MTGKRQKKPKSSATNVDATPQKVRRCQVLFVLGSGFDPADRAADLATEFQTDVPDGLDFSHAKPVVRAASAWAADDKAGFRTSVTTCIRSWFAEHKMTFDDAGLLVRDYRDDDGRLFAVAAYFPRMQGSASHTSSDPTSTVAEDVQQFSLADRGREIGLRMLARLKAIPPKRAVFAAVILAIGFAGITIGPRLVEQARGLMATANSDRPVADPDRPAINKPTAESTDDDSPPQPQFAKAVVSIYTVEPGYSVAVDHHPVRDADGQLVTTPCAVTTEAGPHRITVFRKGFLDRTRLVNVSTDSEAEFESAGDEANQDSELLSAPYLDAEIGKPIALESLNSSRPEFDPFIAADGQTIWFVGDRQEGRGLFVATRPTPYHDFESPRILARSADMPATPSTTVDQLIVVYAVPEKGRLMTLQRPNATSEFGEKKVLRFSQKETAHWPSAQILGDGRRMYWVESDKNRVQTFSTSRLEVLSKFEKTLQVDLPGTHPCLTPDGLRQFEFDGQKLIRHYRANTRSKFRGPGEVIARLELPDYGAGQSGRSFFVTQDEQWLYYSTASKNGGDLYAVRLSDGPGWGVRPTGKSIPPKVLAKNDEPMPETPKSNSASPPRSLDPRSLPLPYASHWKVYASLLSERKYDEALALLQTAQTNPAFEPFRELLDWDQEELTAIRTFWEDVSKSLMEMPAGETIRVSGNQLTFAEFKDGIVVAKRGAVEVKRPMLELIPADLSGIYDRKQKSDDADAQFRIAAFLLYDKQGLERSLKVRVDKAGERGKQLVDHRARRKLVLARAELDRKNFGQGVAFLKEARQLAPSSSGIEQEIADVQSLVYTLVKWTPRGKRQWDIQNGSYKAAMERAEDSVLISSEQFENFELSLEWMTESAAQAQGGVYFHYPGQGDLVEKSYKIHVANDFEFKPDMYTTGSLFGITGPDANAVKKAGEWNTLLIRVAKEEVTVVINDQQVLKAGLGSSKIPKKGYVALDGGIGGITYRKVLLSELAAP